MTDSSKSDRVPAVRKGDAARAARLREALRQNLKRRKTQARGRAQTGDGESPHDSAGFVPDKSGD